MRALWGMVAGVGVALVVVMAVRVAPGSRVGDVEFLLVMVLGALVGLLAARTFASRTTS